MNVIDSNTSQPKWTRKPQARPDEVLEAALDVFAVNGFAATRIEDERGFTMLAVLGAMLAIMGLSVAAGAAANGDEHGARQQGSGET